MESLETERDKIQQEHAEADEFPIAVEKTLEDIESRLDELNERDEEYPGEEKEFAGAIISLRNDGQPYPSRIGQARGQASDEYGEI
jgi:ParB family chromosome partitioning protein